jgi:hypothetical protein
MLIIGYAYLQTHYAQLTLADTLIKGMRMHKRESARMSSPNIFHRDTTFRILGLASIPACPSRHWPREQ